MTDAANSASIPASGSDSYAAQARGDDDTYASYYAGMDKVDAAEGRADDGVLPAQRHLGRYGLWIGFGVV